MSKLFYKTAAPDQWTRALGWSGWLAGVMAYGGKVKNLLIGYVKNIVCKNWDVNKIVFKVWNLN